MHDIVSNRRDPGRIVVINDTSIAKGGATRLAVLSAEQLRERGMDVVFLAGDDGQNSDFHRLGISSVGLGNKTLLDAGAARSAARGLYNLAAARMIGDWIARNDTPDTIYHLHGWSQILSPAVFAPLRAVASRLVITAHDFFLVCPNGAYVIFRTGEVCRHVPLGAACLTTSCDRRHAIHKVWRSTRQVIQNVLLRFDGAGPTVIAIHDGMQPFLERGSIPGSAIRTIRNPGRAWSGTRIAAERNAEFLFVGRVTEEKGPDLLIEAGRQAGVPVRIIGDGPLLPRFQAAAHPHVTLDGRLPFDAIAERARHARALVMPSRYPEPFGLVAVEALWSGLPVITTETALLADEIKARGAGLSIPAGDAEALVAAMRRLADAATLRSMSEAAFAATRDLAHTPESWIDALADLYASLIWARGPAARRAG